MEDLLLLWDIAPPPMRGPKGCLMLILAIILVVVGAIVVFITWYKRTKDKRLEMPSILNSNSKTNL